MKKGVLLLALLLLSAGVFIAKGTTIIDDQSLGYLYSLAGKNLNYSSSVPEVQILQLCRKMEAVARAQKDYENLFLIQQITVNSYCLKGDVGLAVSKAQEMYEESKKIKSSTGAALSLQAIGDTYMHSSQNKQAYETFKEAEQMLVSSDNNFLKVRLMLQQVHICMLLNDLTGLQNYLLETRKLLDRSDIPNKKDYVFYVQCYQTFYNIAIKDQELARISLEETRQMKSTDHLFERWFYILNCRYYDMMEDYERSLLYCDSALQVVKKGGNLNEYKNLMLDKASLLTKNGKKSEAFETYKSTKKLADSLQNVRYSQQIDSLHVNYLVDQMAIENTAMHNRFLTWLILCGTGVLLIAILLIYIARKKNKRLIESKKKLEIIKQETADSIQSKSLFLSNMSHELRTPLNAIVGFADLLAMEAIDDSESKRQFGERIKQNADLLVRLFNDVADLSALKDNNITFSLGIYDIVALCRNVIDTVENVKQTSASLKFVTSLESLQLHTDSGRLQQVLINLLINSTKFTSSGTITLTLLVDEERSEAVFSVEDTGCGIPLDKQPHIFERFEKLHEGVQGAGLGLSICQLIVEHLGGRIWIDSEYTQGARFVFTHPLSNTNNKEIDA